LNLSYKFIEAQSGAFFVPSISLSSASVEPLKIQDLPLTECCVDIHRSIGEVAGLFERHPDWPGVILTARDQFVGLLTRRECSEFLGNLPGAGLFAEVSIFVFFEKHTTCSLFLGGSTSVHEAARAALSREGASVDDPLVVRLGEHHYGLLDVQVLLRAHNAPLKNHTGGD